MFTILKRAAFILVSGWMVMACGGDDGGSADAGRIDAGDQGADCVGLLEDLYVAIHAAASCDLDAADPCSGAVTALDECGCAFVVNDNFADVDAVRATTAMYRDQCSLAGCTGVLCDEGATGVCHDALDGAGGRCRWVVE